MPTLFRFWHLPDAAGLFLVDGAVHGLRAEDIGQNLRIDPHLIPSATAVNEDVIQIQNRLLNINRHLLTGTKGAGTAHHVTGISLRLFGLTGGNMLDADLTGQILRGDFAVAVHQNDERLSVFILHDERFDNLMMVQSAG